MPVCLKHTRRLHDAANAACKALGVQQANRTVHLKAYVSHYCLQQLTKRLPAAAVKASRVSWMGSDGPHQQVAACAQ